MPGAVLCTIDKKKSRTQSLLSDVNGSNMGEDEVITLPTHLVYDYCLPGVILFERVAW